jgi:uncharacterized YccA/Bax inhibitor family protein
MQAHLGRRHNRQPSGGHLSLRSANPALSSKVFTGLASPTGQVMTLNGTVNKVTISLSILMICGYFTYSMEITAFILVGFLGGFIIALATIFKKHWSPVTVPLYAALEGLALGGLSFYFEQMYNGIVVQAIMLTLGILLSLLLAYKSRLIKPSENFKLGIAAATGGIFFVYLIGFVMSLFGGGLSFLSINNSSLFSIGFSLLVVIIASLNLVLDFDFIEEGAERGAPKYMEWYGAFGLLVTLIWLYIEMLHLLAKLRGRQ